jgi:hypothetical protein
MPSISHEGLAAYEYRSPTFRRIVAKGWAEGEADAVLEVLDTREIAVPEDVRVRITTCTDLAQLKLWVRRAVTVQSVEELFA